MCLLNLKKKWMLGTPDKDIWRRILYVKDFLRTLIGLNLLYILL